MGFFSKIGKGIKKVFKKIGKAVKSGFKKFGKFMNKIGILGQLAMMFILPGVGGALMKGLSGAFKGLVGATAEGVKAAAVTSQATASAGAAASTAVGTGTATATQTAAIKAGEVATKSLTKQLGKGILEGSIKGTLKATRGTGLLGSSSGLLNGVGTVLKAAGNFVGTGVKAFSTVTEGISSFIGEFSKTALNKIPGINIGSAAPTMGQAWKNVQNSVMKNASGTIQAFNTSIGIKPTAGATKFGTAGYTTPARVSVDSLKAVNPQNEIISSEISDMKKEFDLKNAQESATKRNQNAFNNMQPKGYTEADRLAGFPDVSGEGVAGQPNSLLNKQPVPVNPQNDIISSEISEMKRKFDLKNAKIGTNVVTPESDPNVANLNFGEQLVQNVVELPGKLKESILSFPTKISTIPERIGDDLTNTIAKAPSTLLNAAANRKPADQVTNNQVALGNIPESTYGINQSNIAESGIAVAGYQSKVNPSALYGTDGQAYNQFLKMLGPQPQQVRS